LAPTEASGGAKVIPLDWAPNPAGNVVLVDQLWGDLRARLLGRGAPRPPDVAMFMPHHATCPAAAAWKRKRAGDRADEARP
jgi:hypothetical protein